MLLENVETLTVRLCQILDERSIEVPSADMVELAANGTFESLGLKFLTQFDLEKCDVIELPDDFYE